MTTARVRFLEEFSEPYMKAWGKKVLADVGKAVSQGGEIGDALSRRKRKTSKSKERPKKDPTSRKERTRLARRAKELRERARKEDGREKRTPKGKGDGGDQVVPRDRREDRLRGKLAEFRERAAGRGAGLRSKRKSNKRLKRDPEDVISVGEEASYSADTEEDSSCVLEEPEWKLGSGTRLSGPLALTHKSHQELEAEQRKLEKNRRSSQMKKPEAQLLAIAAQQRDRRDLKEDGSSQKERGRSKGKDKEKRKKRKKEKKRRRKEKKRKKKSRKPGGSSDNSSSSSSRSDKSRRSRREGSSGSSSGSSLLAPLQRKSRQNPGGVLKMLIKHARLLMDQDTAVDVGEEENITCWVEFE